MKVTSMSSTMCPEDEMMHGEGMLCWSDDFGVCRYKVGMLGQSICRFGSPLSKWCERKLDRWQAFSLPSLQKCISYIILTIYIYFIK